MATPGAFTDAKSSSCHRAVGPRPNKHAPSRVSIPPPRLGEVPGALADAGAGHPRADRGKIGLEPVSFSHACITRVLSRGHATGVDPDAVSNRAGGE
jgi:hypothetical protein